MGDSQRGPPDPEARETVEEWYYKRYRSGTAWEHHWAVSTGTNSRVICSEKEASSVITTPMYIMPQNKRSELWKITIDDWGDRLLQETVLVPAVPIYAFCMCKFYNVRYGQVTLERTSYHSPGKVLSTQDSDGWYVTSFPYRADRVDAGDILWKRLKRRMYIASNGSELEHYDQEELKCTQFCLGNHIDRFHSNFCWECRGGIPGLGYAWRICQCKTVGDDCLVDLSADPELDGFLSNQDANSLGIDLVMDEFQDG